MRVLPWVLSDYANRSLLVMVGRSGSPMRKRFRHRFGWGVDFGGEKLKVLLFSPLLLLLRPQPPDLCPSSVITNGGVTGALIRLTPAMSKPSMAGFPLFCLSHSSTDLEIWPSIATELQIWKLTTAARSHGRAAVARNMVTDLEVPSRATMAYGLPLSPPPSPAIGSWSLPVQIWAGVVPPDLVSSMDASPARPWLARRLLHRSGDRSLSMAMSLDGEFEIPSSMDCEVKRRKRKQRNRCQGRAAMDKRRHEWVDHRDNGEGWTLGNGRLGRDAGNSTGGDGWGTREGWAQCGWRWRRKRRWRRKVRGIEIFYIESSDQKTVNI